MRLIQEIEALNVDYALLKLTIILVCYVLSINLLMLILSVFEVTWAYEFYLPKNVYPCIYFTLIFQHRLMNAIVQYVHLSQWRSLDDTISFLQQISLALTNVNEMSSL